MEVPIEDLGDWERTHDCGTLHADYIGQRVLLMGWVWRRRALERAAPRVASNETVTERQSLPQIRVLPNTRCGQIGLPGSRGVRGPDLSELGAGQD